MPPLFQCVGNESKNERKTYFEYWIFRSILTVRAALVVAPQVYASVHDVCECE
jgi:hypothetical protein